MQPDRPPPKPSRPLTGGMRTPAGELWSQGLRPRPFVAVAGAITLGATVLAYAALIEPEWLKVTRVELTLPRLSPAFGGYKVAHLSDMHIDHRLRPGFLRRVVRAVNRQKPDLVAFTGDFVHGEVGQYTSKLAPLLAELRPRDATVAVLGNHDHFNDPELLLRLLKECGVTDLNNRAHTVRRAGESLHIAGVDSVEEHRDRLDRVLRQLPEEGAAILLAHEPDFADVSLPTGRFDLQLSGHTHAGQVRMPLLGPLKLPSRGKKYHSGLYELPGMWLYTTGGVGMGRPRVRFNCRPEITVITLRANQTGGIR